MDGQDCAGAIDDLHHLSYIGENLSSLKVCGDGKGLTVAFYYQFSWFLGFSATN